MSGFDKEWLSLREPADRRARDAALLDEAVNAIAGSDRRHILDIGCGTGSTFRTVAPKLGANIRWTLFDHDQRLLDEAKRRHGGEDLKLLRGDLNAIEALPLKDIALVTASALFDLCSEAFIETFARHLADANVGLYAALSYDGEMTWSAPHPLDEAVKAAFNAHQRTDKGFGPSLGPSAWTALADRLKAHAFNIRIAESPWLMTREHADLQRLFLKGVAGAASASRSLTGGDLADWLDFRLRAIQAEGSSCRVGHQDVLALR